MSLQPIDIVLRANTGNTASAIDTVVAKIKALGPAADSSGNATKKLGDTAAAAGQHGKKGIDDLDASVRKLGPSADHAGGKLGNLEHTLHTLEGALALGALDAIVEKFGEMGMEADRLHGKMKALLGGAGLDTGAAEEVDKLARSIAAASGGDEHEIANKIAAGVATGRVMGLARDYGIVLSQNAKDAIKAAAATSQQAGVQERLNQILLAGGAAIGVMKTETSTATQQIGEFDVRWRHVVEGIGSGSNNAKAAVLGGVLTPILDVIDASPGLQDAAGNFAFIGAGAMTAGFSVIQLGAQLGQLTLLFPGLADAATAAFAAIKAGALTTLGVLGAVAAGIALGDTVAMSGPGREMHEDFQRWKAGGNYTAMWEQLNKTANDPTASNQVKADTYAQAIKNFEEADLMSDAAKVKERYKALTGKDYVAADASPGDKRAAAAENVLAQIKAAQAGGQAPATSPVMQGAALADDMEGGSVDSIEDELHSGAKLDKGTRKALGNRLYFARKEERAQKANEREQTREQKAEARANTRDRKKAEAEAKKEGRDRDEITIAQMDADLAVKVSDLKAQKTRGHSAFNASIDRQIAQLKATERVDRASLHGDDTKAAAIARIRAGSVVGMGMKLGQGGFGGGAGQVGGDDLAMLRSGRTVFDLMRMSHQGRGGGGNAGGSGSGGPFVVDLDLAASATVTQHGYGEQIVELRFNTNTVRFAIPNLTYQAARRLRH